MIMMMLFLLEYTATARVAASRPSSCKLHLKQPHTFYSRTLPTVATCALSREIISLKLLRQQLVLLHWHGLVADEQRLVSHTSHVTRHTSHADLIPSQTSHVKRLALRYCCIRSMKTMPQWHSHGRDCCSWWALADHVVTSPSVAKPSTASTARQKMQQLGSTSAHALSHTHRPRAALSALLLLFASRT